MQMLDSLARLSVADIGCSDHEMVEIKILREVRKISSGLKIVDFKRTYLVLFKKLVGRIL